MLRKFTLSLIFLLSLCTVSYANFVYATSSGSLGTITISSSTDIAPTIHYTGYLSSPMLASYWNGTGTDILLLDRCGSLSGDRGYIFSTSSLSEFKESRDIPGVFGAELCGYSDNGYSLYLSSGPKIYEVSTTNFTVKNSFDCSQIISADGLSTDIIALAVDTQTIHVLAEAGDSVRYIRFEGQLETGKKLFMSRDASPGASSLVSILNFPAVGHSYGVDLMNSRGRFYSAISTDYTVNALCLDENRRLFYSTQHYDGSEYMNIIRHSDENSLFPETVIESSSPNFTLVRDNDHRETFAAMTDERIIIFTYKNGLTTTSEYTASALGGTPVGVVSATVSGYNKNSSSSGCNTAGLAIITAALLPFMRRKK